MYSRQAESESKGATDLWGEDQASLTIVGLAVVRRLIVFAQMKPCMNQTRAAQESNSAGHHNSLELSHNTCFILYINLSLFQTVVETLNKLTNPSVNSQPQLF